MQPLTIHAKPLPSQIALIVIITTRQTLAEFDVLVADRAVAHGLELLLRGPDLPAFALLAHAMLHDDLAAALLEEERTLLHVRVQLAVDEDTGVDVGLCALTQHLVLKHDTLVQVGDLAELLGG